MGRRLASKNGKLLYGISLRLIHLRIKLTYCNMNAVCLEVLV